MKRTPLYAEHVKLGGRLVEFGGWEMPVHYTTILDEHQAVRSAAGLFDIAHMGEVGITGAGAAGFLNRTLTNDVNRLAVGQGQYTLMCGEAGGVVDDLYLYRIGSEAFLLVINASRIDDDLAWLRARWAADPHSSEVSVVDRSVEMGALAVQGPAVAGFVDGCFTGPSSGGLSVGRPTELKKNELARFGFGGDAVWVARTGYTGEDGFEVMTPAGLLVSLWNVLLAAGRPVGLKPCGLGARDTLRTEMGYPLYGHELDGETTPIEAGLGFFVALDKGDFAGRSVLASQKEQGVSRRCVAFRMTERSAPPRPGYPIWAADSSATPMGRVASGTLSPSLGVGIGMGYVPKALAAAGTRVEIEIRGRRWPAVVVAKPIYRRPSVTSV